MVDPWKSEGQQDKRWWYVAAGVVILAIALVLMVFLVKPAMTGFSVYSAMQASGVPDQYATNMSGLVADKTSAEAAEASAQAQATSFKTLLDQAQEQLQSCSDQLLSCTNNETSVSQQSQALVKSLGVDLATANAAKQSCLQNISAQQDDQLVIDDAARRLCCIQHVSDATINSYDIINDTIICSSVGQQNISC